MFDTIEITTYKPPFPWFGGKARVSGIAWQLLGDVAHYCEPFFGSGAVLFNRPHEPRIETVNDLDHWVANFWRAVQHDPEQVAYNADNPVNEDDLMARHIWLVKHGMPMLAERIPANIDYYDAKIAGWWVWGICCWIGGGWCSGKGPWTEVDGRLVKIPGGTGVKRQLPHLGDAGQGVNRPKTDLTEYFLSLARRLERVRVCSGDWSRIVTNGVLAEGSSVGVFLDPPYSLDLRDSGVYNTDRPDVAKDVLAWCIANGDNQRYRIVLCGYEGEHNALEDLGWRKIAWKASRSYGRASGATANSENRHMERIWYNRNCLAPSNGNGHKPGQGVLFDV